MIVRIAGEGQYRVSDEQVERLNAIDNQLIPIVADGDEARWHELLAQLIEAVESEGEEISIDELQTSDIILPPRDTTIAEARELFHEDGFIPG